MQYLVIYRAHGQLNTETKYYGPFNSFDDAYEYLCTLPAIGTNHTEGENGVKYVQEITSIKSTNHLDLIVKASQLKFGKLLKAKLKEEMKHAVFYSVMCKRDDAPKADCPYMLITARIDKEGETPGRVSFHHGHYDVTLNSANTLWYNLT